MINFRRLDADEISNISRLSAEIEKRSKEYICSLNSSPFDVQDISSDFDALEDAVKELSDYFKELDNLPLKREWKEDN